MENILYIFLLYLYCIILIKKLWKKIWKKNMEKNMDEKSAFFKKFF